MPEEIQQLQLRISRLESLLSILIFSDRYVFQKDLQFQDGRNMQFATGTGTKIGTATGEKIGLYGVTPVVQAGAISAPATQGGSYVQSDVQSIVTAVNSIRTAIKNLGISA